MGSHRVYRERHYAFGQQLLTLRTRAGLTQIALAEEIGVNRRSVQNWETGESYPKAETLQRLLALFLAQGVFIPSQEAAEAAQLWQQVSQDAPHPLGAFDAVWFALLLAERSATPAPAGTPATPLAPASALERVLPEGLVTFLATDIEGSTKRWEHFPQAMQQALVRHHAILHQLSELYAGQVLHTAGDSFICVFADASAALQCALALQRALLAEPWPEVVAPLLIRMALHSGAATAQGERYVAEHTLNRLSRVVALSQGGQILLTQATLDLIGARWPEGVRRRNLGVQQLRDVTVPLQLWQVLAPDLPADVPPLCGIDDRPTTIDGRSTPPYAPMVVGAARSLIDWGEAIDVPALYGRESELGTLQRWVVDERCRVVAILGLGGMGKSSLAITLAHQVLPRFDAVLFRSLQNGPPLAELLDQTIRAVSDQLSTAPEQLPDKIARLVQLLRERRCLLILDNFESILQPDVPTGTYRTGYADYGALMYALSEREHQSCLLLTSREKPAELGPHEGRSAPVRTLPLTGLNEGACQRILEAKDITGTATNVSVLVRLYGGNPLALQLVSEPIHELFGGDVAAFLAMDDAFFNGVGHLLAQQFGRSTPLEQAILYWLAIERELVPLSALLAHLGEAVSQRALLVALESLRRRMLIERAADQPSFTLQPAILEYMTDQLVEAVQHELVDGQPKLVRSHALVQATAKDYVRHSQEQLIARPLLERLAAASGDADALEKRLLLLLAFWREQLRSEQGYGPGNVINLLRLLRGELRGLDLSRLAIRQAELQGVEAQDMSLAEALIQDSAFTEAFDALTAVAISSTGTYWAAASRGGNIQVWNTGGQTLHRMWRAHADLLYALAFSPDGSRLASGSWDGMVKLWDIATGALLWSGRHTGHVNSVAFSPDGRLLASSGDDITVRLWDVQNGKQLHSLPHRDLVIPIAWSPDGRLLATGDVEGCIRLWRVHTNQLPACVRTLSEHTAWVDGLAFSPDGSTLASASNDSTVKLWDMADRRLPQTLSGHTERVTRVAWSPDGRILASSSFDQTIWLWDVEQRSYRTALRGHTAVVVGVAFTADGRGLLSGSEDGTLRVWDTASGRCVRVLQGYATSLYDVDWSPNGTHLISAGSDTLVTIFDVIGRTPPKVLRGHGGVVYGVGWSSDGRTLASSELDNAVRLWDPTSGAYLQVLKYTDDPGNFFYGLAWSPDGQRLAAGTYRHGVLVFEKVAQRPRWVEREFPTWIRQVAWSPDGALLAGGGDDGTVYVWNAEEGTLMAQLAGHHGKVTSVAWNRAGTRLVSVSSGSAGGELLVWEPSRAECLSTITGHPGMYHTVTWGPSEDLVISGGGNGNLRWWDVQRGACVRVRHAHQGTVQALRRSPDGSTLASCGDDGAIVLWDLRTGEYLQTLRRDRPYERMDITDLVGLTQAQRASLLALGAVERPHDRTPALASAPPSDADQPAHGDQRVASSLPSQPTSFIGRSAELAAIARLLADPQCRLLTLLGPGGIGKTRLALAVAAAHTATFADRVTFVALASVSTPFQIVSAIGESLHLDFASQPDPTAHLLGYLHERHMLLVLDNFEHLLAGADLLSAILERAPHLTLLVTSRERLNLQAEWLFDVDGLAFPSEESHGSAAPQSLADLADYSAVQLFVQRARQVQPALALDEATLTTIVRICQHLAGMPLAIELAAAGVRTLSLAEFERQIGAHLDVLATTFRDVPIRHRSLRVVFDHSWQLLSEEERALFSRLAVFRGGWTLAAAEQVAGAAVANLTLLVDKSFVRPSRADSRVFGTHAEWKDAADPRFAMLEPLREYALERLATRKEVEALQRAHASYYLGLAEAAAAQSDSPIADAAIAQLFREHDNLRAVLQWACDTGEGLLGLRLAQALWRFWRSCGYASEGRVWLQHLLNLVDTPTDRAAIEARQRGLHAAAWLASDQHDFAEAARLFEQSAALRRALGETEVEPDVLLNAARQARVQGQYHHATMLIEEGLAHYRARADRASVGSAGLGQSLRELALVVREQGDFARAAELYNECVELYRALSDRERMSLALLGLGDIARDLGDIAKNRTYSEQSLILLRELGIEWAIGFLLNNLALAAYHEGDLTNALGLVNESVALFRAQKADGSLAEVLITLGQVLWAQGEGAAAYTTLTEALHFAWAVGPRLMVAAALEGLACVAVPQGDAELAARLLAAAAALREQMGAPVRPADQAMLDHALATARSMIGADTFAAVWAEAQVLPVEQILNGLPSVAAFTAVRDRSQT